MVINERKNASTEPYKSLGDSLRHNPHLQVIDAFAVEKTVLKYNGAYSSVRDITKCVYII